MSHPLQQRINTINKIIEKYPATSEDHRTRLLIERHSLLRIVHKVPQVVQLPLDWQGPVPTS
jgi:hypothetical protein